MKLRLALLLAFVALGLVGCGGGRRGAKVGKPTPLPEPKTIADRIVHLLPNGAQIVFELDLARLRTNQVIGETVAKALAAPLADLPGDVSVPPLAVADTVVFASYGIGTSNAATIVVISSKQEIADAARLGDNLYAMGPPDWIRQLEARAAVARGKPVHAEEALLRLRERSMPAQAPGASLRVTARLPFDARVALAKDSGLESAPAALSIWADVADDFVIIIDANAVDPGDRKPKQANARLERLLRTALRALADEPKLRALGLAPNISRARMTAGGTWIRTIIAVGPAHLRRVVERANTALAGGGPSS